MTMLPIPSEITVQCSAQHSSHNSQDKFDAFLSFYQGIVLPAELSWSGVVGVISYRQTDKKSQRISCETLPQEINFIHYTTSDQPPFYRFPVSGLINFV